MILMFAIIVRTLHGCCLPFSSFLCISQVHMSVRCRGNKIFYCTPKLTNSVPSIWTSVMTLKPYTLWLCPCSGFLGPPQPKHHQLEGLEQPRFMLSQFWRLEVWNQVVGRAALPRSPGGENPFLLLPTPAVARHSLTADGLTPVSHQVSSWP